VGEGEDEIDVGFTDFGEAFTDFSETFTDGGVGC
jgi:hypothetical protein